MGRISLFVLAGCLLLLVSCGGKDTTPGPNETGFSREAFLRYTVDSWIQPGFLQLEQECDSLVAQTEVFRLNPGAENLGKLRSRWRTAFLSWQRLNSFQFGPAGEDGTRKSLFEEIAIFPVRTAAIDQILETGSFNMTDFNRDTRGFLCLDYLLYAGSETAILQKLNTPNATAYLVAVSIHIRDQVKRVRTSWEGSYRSTFLEQRGTEVGSSTSLVYNAFVKSYESLKNFKMGLPLGKRPGQTGPDTSLLEARYSGLALEAMKAHFQGVNDFWKGTSFDGKSSGQGFRSYLNAVESGPALVTSTETQVNAVQTSLLQVNGQANALFAAADPKLEALNTELQKLTRYYKSDMSSILGIAITFASNDGD